MTGTAATERMAMMPTTARSSTRENARPRFREDGRWEMGDGGAGSFTFTVTFTKAGSGFLEDAS
jgi:hypothetical protein